MEIFGIVITILVFGFAAIFIIVGVVNDKIKEKKDFEKFKKEEQFKKEFKEVLDNNPNSLLDIEVAKKWGVGNVLHALTYKIKCDFETKIKLLFNLGAFSYSSSHIDVSYFGEKTERIGFSVSNLSFYSFLCDEYARCFTYDPNKKTLGGYGDIENIKDGLLCYFLYYALRNDVSANRDSLNSHKISTHVGLSEMHTHFLNHAKKANIKLNSKVVKEAHSLIYSMIPCSWLAWDYNSKETPKCLLDLERALKGACFSSRHFC